MKPFRVEHLSCGYKHTALLKGIHFGLNAGEWLTILGPNGVGKSTLLKTLGRILQPLHGTILFNNKPLSQLGSREFARHIAYSPQAFQPDWPFTVFEFVMLGRIPHSGWWSSPSNADRNVANGLIEELNLTAYRHTRIGELSGGEWQRVRLAKALAQEPSVLLLDEPLAHIDPRFQLEILKLLRDRTRRNVLTVVMTMHDVNLASAWSQYVVLLSSNQAPLFGPAQDVLTTEQLNRTFQVSYDAHEHPSTTHTFFTLSAG